MQIEWKGHSGLSALHTAWSALQFPERVRHLGEGTASAISGLQNSLQSLESQSIAGERFWETMFVAAVEETSDQGLAERTLKKLTGQENGVLSAELQTGLRAIKADFTKQFPNFLDEIPLRVRPLQQLWESCGPGLIRMIQNFTQPELMVSTARVFLVQPILGGFGYAHLATNSLHFEAVLTNEIPALPETLRLAWLLSQLDMERPVYSDLINRFALRRISGLAMIPPVLLAGEGLGITQYRESNVQLALEQWHADCLAGNSEVVGKVLMTWWETYASSQPEWPVALTGLDRMVTE